MHLKWTSLELLLDLKSLHLFCTSFTLEVHLIQISEAQSKDERSAEEVQKITVKEVKIGQECTLGPRTFSAPRGAIQV